MREGYGVRKGIKRNGNGNVNVMMRVLRNSERRRIKRKRMKRKKKR